MFGKRWFLLDDDRRRVQWARENGGKGKVFFFFDRKWGGIISCVFHELRQQEKRVLKW